ncbi:MAG: DUF2071 domain-containing protein [Cyanobacteria bacterium REEB67]|nr:DUF2071 domain-containing protein [Cyanobacteria bacterium REEB67]
MPVAPFYLLKRHPLGVDAHFDFVLVLTYAFPARLLAPLLPPGLVLDTYQSAQPESPALGFVAVAIVRTKNMRPKPLPPELGQDYMLVGYRLFVRYTALAGQRLRGLKILRSDVNSASIVASGNLLTHYNFQYSAIACSADTSQLRLTSRPTDGKSNLSVRAYLPGKLTKNEREKEEKNAKVAIERAPLLPAGSPFKTVKEALKFAGPMPFTFDYEKETNSIVRVEGIRQNWHPQPVQVEVEEIGFLNQAPFDQVEAQLCSAFYITDIPYFWKSGITEALPSCDTSTGDEG